MKWLPFAILALIALALQTTVVAKFELHQGFLREIRPDLMFLLTVYYALWAPWPDAGIAACVLGLAFGALSQNPLGLHALLYGAAAYGIFKARQVVLREFALAQFAIALLSSLVVQFAIWIYLHSAASGRISWGQVFRMATLTALFTAILAPLIFALLHRLARWTGLRVNPRAQAFR